MHHDQIDREIRDVLTEDAKRLRPDADASREHMLEGLGHRARPARRTRTRILLGLGVAAAVAAVAVVLTQTPVREAITPAQGEGCGVGAEIHSEACRNDPYVDFERIAAEHEVFEERRMFVIHRGETDERHWALVAFEQTSRSTVLDRAPVLPRETPIRLLDPPLVVVSSFDGDLGRKENRILALDLPAHFDLFEEHPTSDEAVLFGVADPSATRVVVAIPQEEPIVLEPVRVGDIERGFFVTVVDSTARDHRWDIKAEAFDAEGRQIEPAPPSTSAPTPPGTEGPHRAELEGRLQSEP